MNRATIVSATALLALSGSDRLGRGARPARPVEEAAEYSIPEAANALENPADQVREANLSDPAVADRAMEQAGNAQAPPPPLPPTPGNGE